MHRLKRCLHIQMASPCHRAQLVFQLTLFHNSQRHHWYQHCLIQIHQAHHHPSSRMMVFYFFYMETYFSSTQNNHFHIYFKICHPRTKRQCMVQVKISNQNTRCSNEPLLTQAETNYCLLIFYCLHQYYRSYLYWIIWPNYLGNWVPTVYFQLIDEHVHFIQLCINSQH